MEYPMNPTFNTVKAACTALITAKAASHWKLVLLPVLSADQSYELDINIWASIIVS